MAKKKIDIMLILTFIFLLIIPILYFGLSFFTNINFSELNTIIGIPIPTASIIIGIILAIWAATS